MAAADFSWKPLSALSTQRYIWTGSAAEGSVKPVGILGINAIMPIIISGAVSPNACANPIIVPESVPGNAKGTTWWNTDWNLEAPTANAPSLIDGGTAFNDALHGMIILGKVMSASVIPATNGVDLGNWIVANNICSANKP